MDRSTGPLVVIGTGVFGISTAEHMTERWPTRQLFVVSRPSPLAPSDDNTKIIRTDYPSPERTKESIAAQEMWISTSSFSPFYRTIGRLVAYEDDDSATIENINKTRNFLGRAKREILGGEILNKTFGPSDTPTTMSYILNADDAIVDWKACLESARSRVKRACGASGGRFFETELLSLEHDEGRITAVLLRGGERLDTTTATVILAVGPWCTEVLDKSSIELPPSGRVPVATAVFAYYLRLKEDQTLFFKDKPIFSHIGRGN
jgi:glycine/D-amino acid oxidase-like deaminating enzyme